MDPKKQDCLGHYLYGAGYFSRDENTLSLVTGRGGQAPPNFCMTCPKAAECQDEHEKHVRDLAPEASDNFDRLMAQARSRGVPPTLAAIYIGKKGLDPYAVVAVDNFKQGHADRGLSAGTLTQ